MGRKPLLLAALLAASLPPALAQPLPEGPAFRVNLETLSSQYDPSLATGPDGRFVVVWTSWDQDGSDRGVFGRRFDPAGAALGGEFQVNTTTLDRQNLPSVAMDAGGRFVVAWASRNQDGSGFGVFARRFDSMGVAQSGELQVNQVTQGDQLSPVVAADAQGGFVVTWASDGQDGDMEGVFARRFASSGASLGGEFQVNTYATSVQHRPSLAVGAAGEFIVAWEGVGAGGALGIFARRFDPAGTPLGAQFQVNLSTGYYLVVSAAGMDRDGEFVVAWNGQEPVASYAVLGRSFPASDPNDGGPEFRVDTPTGYFQYPHRIGLGMEDAGRFVVVWDTYPYFTHVEGQLFDRSGSPLGANFLVSDLGCVGCEGRPRTSLTPSGNMVVAWQDYEPGSGASLDVFARRYTAFCPDQDGDGFGAPPSSLCVSRTVADCDDSEAAVFPGAAEINDGVDNQCPGEAGHGLVDELAARTGFTDPADPSLLSWESQAGATLYEVARSPAPDFPAGCTILSTSSASLSDPTLPSPGGALFYIARPASPHPGSWGAATAGERLPGC